MPSRNKISIDQLYQEVFNSKLKDSIIVGNVVIVSERRKKTKHKETLTKTLIQIPPKYLIPIFIIILYLLWILTQNVPLEFVIESFGFLQALF